MSIRGTIIIDDFIDGDVVRNGPTGERGQSPFAPAQIQYNHTLFTPDPAVPADTRTSWTFDVNGYSLALYGITPPEMPVYNQTIRVSDSTKPEAVSTNYSTYTSWTYPAPATHGPFFTSGNLSSSAALSVAISGYRGLTFDYLLVDVGEFTNITGRQIFVDDADTEISWTGGWTVKTDYNLHAQARLPAFPLNSTKPSTDSFDIALLPHGGATHQSSSKGDSFSFTFFGTSIVVYGISPGPLTDDWQLSMNFALDSDTTNSTRMFTASDQQGLIAPYFPYFSASSLASGQHTLNASVVEVIAQSLAPAAQIDFIVYQPSFGTLHEKPAVTPSASVMASSATASMATSGTPAGHSALSRGAIAGGVVGAVVLLVALAVVSLFIMKRRRKQREAEIPGLVAEPFMLPSPTSAPTTSATTSASRPAESPTSMRKGVAIPAGTNERNYAPGIGPPASEGQESMEGRMRELQAEMASLRREMDNQAAASVPPSYAEY